MQRNHVRAVIAGGGVAGLEALIAIRHLAGDRLELTLVAPEPDFVYRPFAVEEPFSHQPAERRVLEPVAREFEATLVAQPLVAVDANRHEALLGDGSSLFYDALIVCVGGRTKRPYESAVAFTAEEEQLAIDELLRGDGEPTRHVAFIVPPGVTWSLPAYELALMTRGRAERLGLADVALSLHSPEDSPLAVFGTAPSDHVARLLAARRIGFHGGNYVTERDGTLYAEPAEEPLDADVAVALPLIEGPRVEGLPSDEAGFIPIDEHARVIGTDDVYAAGDGTNFPVKQGGIATQQADAAAEHTSPRAGAERRAATIPSGAAREAARWRGVDQHDKAIGSEEGDGIVSLDYLWWPPHKIGGVTSLRGWAGRTPDQSCSAATAGRRDLLPTGGIPSPARLIPKAVGRRLAAAAFAGSSAPSQARRARR
jgi:sulfide:quinone oxidoreductase